MTAAYVTLEDGRVYFVDENGVKEVSMQEKDAQAVAAA